MASVKRMFYVVCGVPFLSLMCPCNNVKIMSSQHMNDQAKSWEVGNLELQMIPVLCDIGRSVHLKHGENKTLII